MCCSPSFRWNPAARWKTLCSPRNLWGFPNSLSTEESIKQGCKYFSELLAAAETKGCDLNSVIQSYNYGGGFLDYVAGHGKNTPLNWQRASQGTNPAERKSPTPTLLR